MKPIGTLIKEELEAQERTVAWLARKINVDRTNIYRIFHKNSLDTELLVRISYALRHDFFADYSSAIDFTAPNSYLFDNQSHNGGGEEMPPV